MDHVGAEVLANDAVPRFALELVKFLPYFISNDSLLLLVLKGVENDLLCLLKHIILHVLVVNVEL